MPVEQITQLHLDDLLNYINSGDRGGFYLKLYELTGEKQVLIQASITTYSGVWGGMAITGNFFAKLADPKNYILSLDEFSMAIVVDTFLAVKKSVGSGGTGLLSSADMVVADQLVWENKKMGQLFPGNIQFLLEPTILLSNISKFVSTGTYNSGLAGITALDIRDSSETYTAHELGKRYNDYNDINYDRDDGSKDGILKVRDRVTGHIIFIQDMNPDLPYSLLPGFNDENYRTALDPNSDAYLAREALWNYTQSNQPENTSFKENQVVPNVFQAHALNNGIYVNSSMTLYHQELFNQIQPLNGGIITYTDREEILNAMSNAENEDKGIERFLTLSESLFLGIKNPPIVTSEKNYIDRMNAVLNSPILLKEEKNFELISLINITGSNLVRLSSQSNSEGIAYRYALLNLNPFVITGNNELYSSHNTNDELELDNFSEQYLFNRSLMLEGLNARNMANSVYVPADISWATEKLFFHDVASDTRLSTPPAAFNSPDSSYPPEGQGISRIIFDDDGAHLIEGAEKFDHLYGGAGIDTLSGKEGDDYIEGNTGDDTLNGGKGEDTLDGGDDNDKLYGDEDNDTLEGGAGSDILEGGDGDDYLYANYKEGKKLLDGSEPPVDESENTLYGGKDNDVLHGAAGADILYGDDKENLLTGNDELYGYKGSDKLYGGKGNDTIYANVAEEIDDEEQKDKTSNTLYGGEGNDILFGASGADIIYGDDSADKETGNDVIDGRDGDDKIYGGKGIDELIGGKGGDTIYGDKGNDTIYANVEAEVEDEEQKDITINTLYGGEGNDTIFGASGDDIIYGDDLDDIETGTDIIDGRDGDDEIYGGQGDDEITGGQGGDTIHGGEGNDTIYANVAEEVEDEEQKDETTNKIYGDEGDDTLFGASGDDIIYGDDLDDNETGADIIDGRGGDDEIYGGKGNDTLRW